MEVLLLTQIVPFPPDSGPKIKTFHVIQSLSRRHNITLVSFVRSQEEIRRAQELEAYCREVRPVPLARSMVRDGYFLTRSLFSSQPFLILRDFYPAMRDAVRRVSQQRNFDIVHADQLSMAQYALMASGKARIFDAHNAVWTIVRRLCQVQKPGPKKVLLELEWRKMRRYEGWVCTQFDHVLAVTQEDAAALQSAAGAYRIGSTVVPIAVDVLGSRPVERRSGVKNIISVGTMFYPPNIDGVLWFIREVFPLVKQGSPETKFYVVGAKPPRIVQEMAEKDPSIVVTGYVDDLGPLLADCALLVVPLRSGSGMRVKILESFAWGLPVVSTTIGYEGIEVTPGEDILAADSPEDFARSVLEAICTPELARCLSRNGRRLAEEKYDWRAVCGKLNEVYDQTVAAKAEAAGGRV